MASTAHKHEAYKTFLAIHTLSLAIRQGLPRHTYDVCVMYMKAWPYTNVQLYL